MPGRSVLVLNAGSSSLKWVVLDAESEAVLHEGQASWQGTEGGRHQAELEAALAQVPPVQAIGHRVVHGGTRFRDATLVDDTVRTQILDLAELAPLHNPAAVAGMDAAKARFPDVPQVAAFDTAFHATMPEAAALYPIPWEWTSRWELRRFGFHGLSVQYAARRAAEILGPAARRLVVCHLGAGCSVTAVLEGRSVDTSMGLTPLEGLMMARRSGSVDPGLLVYLLNYKGVTPAELDHGLNEQAGLLGVSGVSADMREVLAAASHADNTRARLAIDMFVHRLVSTIGGMLATLGGLDALIFTGGIGEHSAVIRARACAQLGFAGLRLGTDPEGASADRDIAAADSAVKALVITAREDLSILRGVKGTLGWASVAQSMWP